MAISRDIMVQAEDSLSTKAKQWLAGNLLLARVSKRKEGLLPL